MANIVLLQEGCDVRAGVSLHETHGVGKDLFRRTSVRIETSAKPFLSAKVGRSDQELIVNTERVHHAYRSPSANGLGLSPLHLSWRGFASILPGSSSPEERGISIGRERVPVDTRVGICPREADGAPPKSRCHQARRFPLNRKRDESIQSKHRGQYHHSSGLHKFLVSFSVGIDPKAERASAST